MFLTEVSSRVSLMFKEKYISFEVVLKVLKDRLNYIATCRYFDIGLFRNNLFFTEGRFGLNSFCTMQKSIFCLILASAEH